MTTTRPQVSENAAGSIATHPKDQRCWNRISPESPTLRCLRPAFPLEGIDGTCYVQIIQAGIVLFYGTGQEWNAKQSVDTINDNDEMHINILIKD